MSDGTKIEWTDATWNPVTGCSVVSPGCTNCYAMTLAGTRMKNHPSRAGLTTPSRAGPVWNGKVKFNEDWLSQPLHWRKPRRIFVCAHGDLFAENVPDDWIDAVFAVMALCPQHTFQVLTKRADRMREYLKGNLCASGVLGRVTSIYADGYIRGYWSKQVRVQWPLPNVWLGVSVEDQARADERIPELLATPAAVRFVSAEPLLGPVDVERWLHDSDCHLFPKMGDWTDICTCCDPREVRLDWIIAGGESGRSARPMNPGWARSLRDQCQAADVQFFFKQWGEFVSVSEQEGEGAHHRFPDGATVRRIGKKRATRTLDGREWNGVPE